MRYAILTLLFAAAVSCADAQKNTVPDAILGDWYGESKCVGSNSSCHDEIVIYHLTRLNGEASKVHFAADKVVNGKPESMGEFDMAYDGAAATLTAEFKIPRTGGTGVWLFKIDGDKMHGTLTIYPEKEVGRRAEVSRKKPDKQ